MSFCYLYISYNKKSLKLFSLPLERNFSPKLLKFIFRSLRLAQHVAVA
jgi:hypothetical protein